MVGDKRKISWLKVDRLGRLIELREQSLKLSKEILTLIEVLEKHPSLEVMEMVSLKCQERKEMGDQIDSFLKRNLERRSYEKLEDQFELFDNLSLDFFLQKYGLPDLEDLENVTTNSLNEILN